MKAVVTSKGQITIPIAIRTAFKIVPGSKLDFQVDEEGSLQVSLLNQEVSQLKGIVKTRKKKPVSLEEMKEAIKEASKKGTS
jgi:antitoxin PrlF